MQEYRQGSDARKLVWVAWLQTGEGKTGEVSFRELPGEVDHASSSRDAVASQGNLYRIQVSESPLYVFLEKR